MLSDSQFRFHDDDKLRRKSNTFRQWCTHNGHMCPEGGRTTAVFTASFNEKQLSGAGARDSLTSFNKDVSGGRGGDYRLLVPRARDTMIHWLYYGLFCHKASASEALVLGDEAKNRSGC